MDGRMDGWRMDPSTTAVPHRCMVFLATEQKGNASFGRYYCLCRHLLPKANCIVTSCTIIYLETGDFRQLKQKQNETGVTECLEAKYPSSFINW